MVPAGWLQVRHFLPLSCWQMWPLVQLGWAVVTTSLWVSRAGWVVMFLMVRAGVGFACSSGGWCIGKPRDRW